MSNGHFYRISNIRLPHEVTDMIIDYLRGDEATLRSCAAVCRAFFLRSRYNLFQSIHISTGSELTRLARLSRKWPELLRWFCQLHISDTEGHAQEAGRIAHSAPLILIHILPRVKTLTLENLEWHAAPPHPNCGIPQSYHFFKSVAELTLRSCTFQNLAQLKQIIQSFPALSTLDLSRVSVSSGHQRLPDDYAGPALANLSIIECTPDTSEALLRWLSSGRSRRSLRTLVLRTPVSSQLLADVLTTSNSLNQLTVSPPADVNMLQGGLGSLGRLRAADLALPSCKRNRCGVANCLEEVIKFFRRCSWTHGEHQTLFRHPSSQPRRRPSVELDLVGHKENVYDGERPSLRHAKSISTVDPAAV